MIYAACLCLGLLPQPSDHYRVEAEVYLDVDQPVQPQPPGREFQERAALVQLAVAKEWIGPDRATAWYYHNGLWEDLVKDFRRTRKRLDDAPPLEDHKLFCPHRDIWVMWERSRDFRTALHRLYANGYWLTDEERIEIEDAIRECDRLSNLWDYAWRAGKPDVDVGNRRDDLKKLKILIGEEAYYRGELPPMTPFHYVEKWAKWF